jgi:hypothetical protein
MRGEVEGEVELVIENPGYLFGALIREVEL